MEEPRHNVLMNIWNIIQTMETKDSQRKKEQKHCYATKNMI